MGLVITAIGKTSETIQIGEDHGRKCPGCCRLHVTKQVKSDFQIIETHGYGFCNEKHIIKSGSNIDTNTKKKRGWQVSEISKIMGHAAHTAALNPRQLEEFLD